MTVDLPASQQSFLECLVAAGRFPTVNDAVREGVELLISHEDLKREVQLGIDQADRGELVDHATVFNHLRAIASAADQVAGS